jgi:hypothetical protein
VDPLPTPTGSWLFVERRGEEFFPVLPLKTVQQDGLQAAGANVEPFINGPYQVCPLRANTIHKYHLQQGGAGAADGGGGDPPSPGDPSQQQQTPPPGRPKGKRLRALRVMNPFRRGARGASTLSAARTRYVPSA